MHLGKFVIHLLQLLADTLVFLCVGLCGSRSDRVSVSSPQNPQSHFYYYALSARVTQPEMLPLFSVSSTELLLLGVELAE